MFLFSVREGFDVTRRHAKNVPHEVAMSMLAMWMIATYADFARADGGAIVAHARRGDRDVTIFASPVPLVVGPMDISVLVQSADTGEPVLDADIVVSIYPASSADSVRKKTATTGDATNKLLRAATFEIGVPGNWTVEVTVDGSPPIQANVAVGEPWPSWLELAIWIALPFAVVLAYAVRMMFAKGPSQNHR